MIESSHSGYWMRQAATREVLLDSRGRIIDANPCTCGANRREECGSLTTKSGRDERIRILPLGQKIDRPKALSTLELAKWHYKVALLGLILRRNIDVNCMNIV
jgi:hypothetical protein